MTLNADQVAETAQDLLEAERIGQQIGLLSRRFPGLTLQEAYDIQAALVQAKLAEGRHQTGWKIGLTSRAMQDALQIDTPDSGVLLDDMHFDSGSEVPKGRFIQPRIEAEITFIMGSDLAEKPTREQVLDATSAVVPSLEILDTRIVRRDPVTGAIRVVADTIADNAANAGIVLGQERHRPSDIDLRWVGAIVSRDGVVEETGLGAAVLDDPVVSVIWLAERLATQGARIQAGQLVLSGSFIRPIEAPPGSQIEADFGPFGHVAIAFA